MSKYSLGELIWKVTGDSSGLNKAVTESDNRITKLAKSAAKTGTVIAGALAVAAGVAAKKLVGMASDAAETQQKFDVVFAGVGKGANQMADDFAKAYGVSRTESRQLLAATGDLLAGFGFTSQASMDLSLQVNRLAADLVSFSNYQGGTEEASRAITAALLGEREAIKSLGIAILDADVKAKVAIMRSQGMTFATQRQAEAYATLQIAMEQSKNAIGDLERSKMSFANQTRFAEAAIKDEATALGNALLPYANLALTAFREMNAAVTDNLDSFTSFTKDATTVSAVSNILADSIGTTSLLFKIGRTWIDDFNKGLNLSSFKMSSLTDDLSAGSHDLTLFNAMMASGSVAAVTFGSGLSVLLNTVLDTTDAAILMGKALISVLTVGKGKGIAQAQEDLDNFNKSLSNIPRNLGENLATMIDDVSTVSSRVIKNFDHVGADILKGVTDTQDKIKRATTRSLSETGTARDYELEKEKARLKEQVDAQRMATEAALADQDKVNKKAQKEKDKQDKKDAREIESKKEKAIKAAKDAAEGSRKYAEEAFAVAVKLYQEQGTSASVLAQMQIDEAYRVAEEADRAAQKAEIAYKSSSDNQALATLEANRLIAESYEKSAKAAVEANKVSADSASDATKNMIDAQKEAKDALESLTPEGLAYYSMFGEVSQDELTSKLADYYNKIGEQIKSEKEAIDKLTPGGLIVYSMMGEAGYEGTVEQLADQASEIASMVGDMYSNLGDVINDYYQNQIDAIKADADARKDAIDAEVEDKIAALDKSAMSEEDYNATVDAINKEADNQKAQIEREAAQRSYRLQVEQFKSKQHFDEMEVVSNTAVAVMKAWSQLGIFGKVAAVMIAAIGAMQVANIKAQQPPEPPAFENGGIVPYSPGVPTTGDNMLVRTNPGELILNEAQQDTISGKLSGNSPINITIITPDKRTLYKGIYDASKRGEVLIDTRAVVK